MMIVYIKRIICVMLVAVLSVSVCSCGKKSSSELEYSAAGYKAELKHETLELDGVLALIKYPQLEGSAYDDTLNSALRALAVEKLRLKNLVAYDGVTIYYTVEEAELTLVSGELLSGYFAGRISCEGAQHDDFFAYTVNCDMKNGRILRSSELIDDLANLRKKFVSGSFKEYPDNGKMIESFGYENLFAAFREDYAIYPDVYFSSSAVGLCIETIYLYGGYSRFEAPYSDVGACFEAALGRFGLGLKND